MIESLHISDAPLKKTAPACHKTARRTLYICNKQPTNPERTPDTTMENNVLTIFTRIRQRLHTTARSIAGEDNADDVLQDAFCKLWTLKIQPTNVCGATDDAKEQDMRERFDAVKRIVEMQLSDTQRRVLWMRDYEGYSFAEIAAAVDMTEENVRQTLSRARKQIRETYKNIN